DFSPMSIRSVGPNFSRRSAGVSLPLPVLNPAWAVRMGWSEHRRSGQLDGGGSDLADQVRTHVKPLDRGARCRLKIGESFDIPAVMKDDPLSPMMGFEIGLHLFEGGN